MCRAWGRDPGWLDTLDEDTRRAVVRAHLHRQRRDAEEHAAMIRAIQPAVRAAIGDVLVSMGLARRQSTHYDADTHTVRIG